jgi:hypothetical protein
VEDDEADDLDAKCREGAGMAIKTVISIWASGAEVLDEGLCLGKGGS